MLDHFCGSIYVLRSEEGNKQTKSQRLQDVIVCSQLVTWERVRASTDYSRSSSRSLVCLLHGREKILFLEDNNLYGF